MFDFPDIFLHFPAVKEIPIEFHGPDLDQGQLDDLIGPSNRADLGLLAEILDLFQKEAGELLDLMEDAAGARDRIQLGRLLHSLGGSSANLGLARLSGLAVEAEASLPQFDDALLPGLDGFFRRELRDSLAVLEEKYRLRAGT